MDIINGDFIGTIMPVIHKYAVEFVLPIEGICGGQVCLESHFGTSELATEANNLFGRKHREGFKAYYKTTKERIPVPDDYVLEEPEAIFEPWFLHPFSQELIAKGFIPIESMPNWYLKQLAFNHYDTWEDGVKDYFFCISTFDAYEEARESLPDLNACLTAIGRRYATDDTYREKVQNIIDRYNLNAYYQS